MRIRRFALLSAGLMLIAALAYAAYVVRRGFSTRSQPSIVEAAVARTIRAWSIPQADREQSNPWTDKATAEVMAEARAHWADHCAICHANDGSGTTDIGRNLYPKAPDMRLPATQNMSDGELYYIIRNGVRLTGMPAWGDPASPQDDESWQLVLFIRHLPEITPEELREMERLNPKTEAQRIADQEAERFLNEGTIPQSQEQMHH
jgi:mono/diheme cytochrome c family protein